MNRGELAAGVAEAAGIGKAEAGRAVDAVFEAISDALKKGEEVRLLRFGTFLVSDRPAREGKNPRTGEAIKIAAAKAPKFSAGKGLKDAVNG